MSQGAENTVLAGGVVGRGVEDSPPPHASGLQEGVATPDKPQGWSVGNVAKQQDHPGYAPRMVTRHASSNGGVSATTRLFRDLRRLLVPRENGLSLSRERVEQLRGLLAEAEAEQPVGELFERKRRVG